MTESPSRTELRWVHEKDERFGWDVARIEYYSWGTQVFVIGDECPMDVEEFDLGDLVDAPEKYKS